MPDAPTFDLQSHSTWSDGALAPADVVEAAARAGVTLLALTDHDAVDGTDEALDAGEAYGVKIVPAVEVTAVDRVATDLHILGYGVDHRSPHLAEYLAAYRADRDTRADRMLASLRELGFELDDTVLRTRRSAGLPIGRPHVATAVFNHPGNRARLRDEGLDATPSDVLVAYLTPGRPAFQTRKGPQVDEAIEVIHAAGGLAVWAHPFWDVAIDQEVADTLRRFKGLGLDGVEAFYIEHDQHQTTLLVELAAELDLLTTGSADFHGPGHAHFSRFRAFELYGHTPNLGPIDRR